MPSDKTSSAAHAHVGQPPSAAAPANAGPAGMMALGDASAVRPTLPPGQTECFVYLQMPGSLEVVTCGRLEQQRLPTGETIGRFVYGRRYRARRDALPLDEGELGELTGQKETTLLKGVFGALRDAAPDAWGRSVIQKQLGQADLTEVDFLLHSPEDRAGALSFGTSATPPAPAWQFNRIVQLAELREAARVLEEDPVGLTLPTQLHDLMFKPGTSMGGARPKNVIEDDDGLWIAKFPARNDRWNNAAVEAAMLDLADACGIRTPAVRIERVGGESILLVARFDRTRAPAERTGNGADHETGATPPRWRYLRHRLVSALTVLGADESSTDRSLWSYLILADELRRWAPATEGRDRVELFRRMVLNALVSNTDDHPRNHALIAPGRAFELSPAYDITPFPARGLERDLAMACGPYGRAARRDNLVAAAPHFGLSSDDAEVLIDTMRATVAGQWEALVRARGGSPADCAAIEGAFIPASFDYPSPGASPR